MYLHLGTYMYIDLEYMYSRVVSGERWSAGRAAPFSLLVYVALKAGADEGHFVGGIRVSCNQAGMYHVKVRANNQSVRISGASR